MELPKSTSGVPTSMTLTRLILWRTSIFCLTALPWCSALDDIVPCQEGQRQLCGTTSVGQLPSQNFTLDDDIINQSTAEVEGITTTRVETTETTPLKPPLIISEDPSTLTSVVGGVMERRMDSVPLMERRMDSVPLNNGTLTPNPAAVTEVTEKIQIFLSTYIPSNIQESRSHVLHTSTVVFTDINEISVPYTSDVQSDHKFQTYAISPSPTFLSANPSHRNTAGITTGNPSSISMPITNTIKSLFDSSSSSNIDNTYSMSTHTQIIANTSSFTEVSQTTTLLQTGILSLQVMPSSTSKSALYDDNISLTPVKVYDHSNTTMTAPSQSLPHNDSTFLSSSPDISSTTSKSVILKGNISLTRVKATDHNKTPMTVSPHNPLYIHESMKSSCRTNLGLTLYQAAWEAGTELPKECWEILCSEETPNSFVKDDIITYWFQKNDPTCYDHLPSSIEPDVQFSKIFVIAPGLRFMLLKPSCIQSRGFAYVDGRGNDSQYLPISCKRNLCNSGAALSYYENYPIVLIEPEIPSSAEISDTCVIEMKHAYKNRNNILKRGSINVYSLNDYPVHSPCPTVVILIIEESGVHVIIPFRASWCPPLTNETWRNFLISFYSIFQSNRTSEFYQCFFHKSGNQTYPNNIYGKFLQDLLNENMTAPEMPKSCVDFFCNEQIEISHINGVNSESSNLWFSYAKNCYKSPCNLLETRASQCQQEISGTDNLHNTTVAKIVLSRSHRTKSKYLFLSMLWSCPSGNGEGRGGRLQAEALYGLWLIDKMLPKICGKLICKSAFYQVDSHVINAYMVDFDSANISMSCRKRASEVHSDVIENVQTFSFVVKEASTTIVFITSKQIIDWQIISLLGILQSTSNMELLYYCDKNPLQVSFDLFNGFKQYTCYQSNNRSLELPPNLKRRHVWSAQITAEKQMVFLKKLPIHKAREKLFIWAISINGNLSSAVENFIISISSSAIFHEFLENFIYILDSKNFHLDGFQAFIAEIQESNLDCKTSRYFTICYQTGSLFPNTVGISAYLVIIHECSISIRDKDKIISLLLTHFHDTRITIDYICNQENMLVLVPSKGLHVIYKTEGPKEEFEDMLDGLRVSSPGRTWINYDLKIPVTDKEFQWCINIRNPSNLLNLLNYDYVCCYSKNNSTIFFRVPDESYYLVYFTLSSAKKRNFNLPLLDWRSQSKIHQTLRLNESNTYASRIFITELERNPVYSSLMEHYATNKKGVLSTVKRFTKILISATLGNNSQCINDLRNSKFLIYETSLVFLIGPIQKDLLDSSCFLSLPQRTTEWIQFFWEQNMTTINKFWPTCLYNFLIISYHFSPFDVDWHYLSYTCKVQEIMLLSFSMIITLITIIGNSLVLVVIFTTDLKRDATFLIRASLAVADLLMGLLPACLAVYDHVSLMTGRLGLRHLDPNSIHASFTQLSSSQSPGFQQVRFERYGYPMVASMMLNISANVSLLTLALMSIERYRVVTNSALSRRQVLVGISSAWCLSIALSLLVNWRQNGWSFAGYFDPITKLTVSIGNSVPSVSLVVFYIQVIVLGAAALAVIILTLVTLIIFSYNDNQTKKLLAIHSAKRDQDAWKVTQVFLSMVALFSMATIPLVVDVMADLSTTSPVGHFFAWWLFMAGASWNWILYSFVGSKFYAQARKLVCKNK